MNLGIGNLLAAQQRGQAQASQGLNSLGARLKQRFSDKKADALSQELLEQQGKIQGATPGINPSAPDPQKLMALAKLDPNMAKFVQATFESGNRQALAQMERETQSASRFANTALQVVDKPNELNSFLRGEASSLLAQGKDASRILDIINTDSPSQKRLKLMRMQTQGMQIDDIIKSNQEQQKIANTSRGLDLESNRDKAAEKQQKFDNQLSTKSTNLDSRKQSLEQSKFNETKRSNLSAENFANRQQSFNESQKRVNESIKKAPTASERKALLKQKKDLKDLQILDKQMTDLINDPNFDGAVGGLDNLTTKLSGALGTKDSILNKRSRRLTNKLALKLGESLSGTMSDGDIKLLMDSIPKPSDPAKVWRDWYNNELKPVVDAAHGLENQASEDQGVITSSGGVKFKKVVK